MAGQGLNRDCELEPDCAAGKAFVESKGSAARPIGSMTLRERRSRL
jgi:hypothetical protein